MHYFSTQEVCGTCLNWDGLRMLDEQGMVCVFPNIIGICRGSEKLTAPDHECRSRRWARWDANSPDYIYLSEVKCWEFTNCGYEEGGENALLHGVCDAYPNHGRLCNTVSNTKCNIGCNSGKSRLSVSGTRSCHKCGFYKAILSIDA